MQCNIPGCDEMANATFAKVPVCRMHRFKLLDEASLFYSKGINNRQLFELIRQKSPWKKLEEGDKHQAIVRKIRNGTVTIYEIKGGTYALQPTRGGRNK
ncbi:hypothetical protein DMN77_08190 [Paenibacillus sp. 79R4]|uniref:hypothetical protein n=1 Tax=Paenibacillus sp. 79R4 TaxID=2212847 RepID=UPI0015C021D0|nr:hypothetical protein [Paenibacillus sp. 79R4]NWL87583.1 hypothetical protein [Paenibacillus sp. 79R4]